MMKRLMTKTLQHLSDVFFPRGTKTMLCVNFKKLFILSALLFACSSILFATDSYALFDDLAKHGGKIFTGMREIIYAVSGIGVIAIAIGSILEVLTGNG